MKKKTREEILNLLKDGRIKFTIGSGILTTKPELIEWVDKNIPEVEVITTKSFQIEETSGNREPIIVEHSIGNFGNAVGLKNPGMDKAYEELKKLKQKGMKSLLNVSLAAKSPEDFIILVKKFENLADIIELNFSCPHASSGFGSSIGCDCDVVKDYMKKIRKETNALLFPKLTPNTQNIGLIAKSAIENGADGIVAINTIGPELYVEPYTKKPILYNPQGRKGGKSGDWIKEITLEKIKEIRDAVGDEIPIIGMGGVSNGNDVNNIINAGADVVGIGSVLARVEMSKRPDFFRLLKEDSIKNKNEASKFLSIKRLAEYKPYKITKILDKTETLRIIEVEGKIDFNSSQFVFLWVADVGEKPFAVACNDPLTFIIRKKKYIPEENKGLLTNALFNLKENDDLMIRGIYGKDAPSSLKKNAVIVAGGTGIAIVPSLAEKLNKEGKNVIVYYGITDDKEVVLEEKISKYGKYIPISDNGKLGRVLDVMEEQLSDFSETCFYNMGPIPLMIKAMEIQEKKGASKKDIFSSLETNTMCGIGICGECVCGSKLLCHEGTFISKQFIDENKINILDI
jgi:dihydroorotate dehydrogenase electron transfer subunit